MNTKNNTSILSILNSKLLESETKLKANIIKDGHLIDYEYYKGKCDAYKEVIKIISNQ